MDLMAIDPGETTGICIVKTPTAHNTPSDSHSRTFQVVLATQIPWGRRLVDLEALLAGSFLTELPRPDILVIESFRLRPGRAMEQVGSVFPSVRIIGIVEALAYVLYPASGLPMIFQEPSIMSRVQILDEHAACLVGQPHAADAYRHARYYLATTGE